MITKLINSAATTNGQRVMNPARGTELWSVDCFNNGGAAAYVKLYDVVDVVVGTTVPAMIIAVPAGGNARLFFRQGMQFRTCLSLAITNLAADSDTTAVAAGQVKVAVVYGG